MIQKTHTICQRHIIKHDHFKNTLLWVHVEALSHICVFNTFFRLATKDKDIPNAFIVISEFVYIFICVCVCVHCPEALQIQAVMPKHGQGGGHWGEVWGGGRRTVQQVTFDLLSPQLWQPLTTGRFDSCWLLGASHIPGQQQYHANTNPTFIYDSWFLREWWISSQVQTHTGWFLLLLCDHIWYIDIEWRTAGMPGSVLLALLFNHNFLLILPQIGYSHMEETQIRI